MTATITPITPDTTTEPQFAYVEAASVQLETNVRTDAILDPEFLESIDKYGVLTPVLAKLDNAGVLHVRIGQRRTLAAQQLGKKLPVIFYTEGDEAEEPAWMRTVIQVVENDHRSELTTAQRVSAFRQLELDGLSVTKIAGALSVPKERVKAGLAVAKTERTLAAAAEYEIDLLQLAALVEFADDEDTYTDLLEVAVNNPDYFDHALSRAQQSKESARAVAARREELEAQGIATYGSGQEVEGTAYREYQLKRDESIEVDPELGDGFSYIIVAGYGGTINETKIISDPAKYGYTVTFENSGQSGQRSGPMTDAEKAARRTVIASNKAWDAAEPVRLAWLTEFFSRKSFPKDAGSFVAVALTRHEYELHNQSDENAHTWTGIERKNGYGSNALADLVEANPAKAGIVTLALVLSKLESGTSRETWRHEQKASRFYLLQLRSWGYNLAPIEEVALGELEALPDVDEAINPADYEDEPTDEQ